MASAYDFHLTVPPHEARARVRQSLSSQGFEVTDTPNGSLVAKRGRLGLTLLVGAMAGNSMHVSFDLQFFSEDAGSVVRFNRSLAGGALKGGALGASRTADVFQNAAHQLGVALHADNVLVRTTES